MKTKKKTHGIKHKIREKKKRQERIGMAVTVAILVVIISVSGFFIHSMLSSSPQKQGTSSTLKSKAAIVDQASLSPAGGFNETFIEKATNILKQAGYTVDYYSGEKVTVEFYRNLPTHSYSLVILRVHSTATEAQGTEAPLALFTSERYSTTKYVNEQLTDQLMIVVYSAEEMEKGIKYFGISPPFVTQSMKGSFQNTIIIMMGCEGLKNPLMAEAFAEKGAKVYISWDKAIFFSHVDAATIHLLQHLLIDKQTIDQAVERTMKEVGPDPADDSILLYYPLEAGAYTVEL